MLGVVEAVEVETEADLVASGEVLGREIEIRNAFDAAPEARGRAFGIFYFVTSIAALLSSILTGELWKHYGAELPFLLSAALAAVSAVLVLIAPKLRIQAMSDLQLRN